MSKTKSLVAILACAIIFPSLLVYTVHISQETPLRTVVLKESVTMKLSSPYGIMDNWTTGVFTNGTEFEIRKGEMLVIEGSIGTNYIVSYFGRGRFASAPYGSQFTVGQRWLEAVSRPK